MHSQAKTVQNQPPSRRVRTHPVSIVNLTFSLHFSHSKDVPRTQPVIPYDVITMIKCRVFPTKLRKANKMSIMCSFKVSNLQHKPRINISLRRSCFLIRARSGAKWTKQITCMQCVGDGEGTAGEGKETKPTKEYEETNLRFILLKCR